MATPAEPIESRAKCGKYLTFVLADETYGLEILTVREIVGVMGITAVPRLPAYVKGVVNLRGKIIPVVDLRLKFGLPEAAHTEETCIIVVYVEDTEVGILVDRVSEVLNITFEEIQDPPSLGTTVDSGFITGIAKCNGRVQILLDVVKALSGTHEGSF